MSNHDEQDTYAVDRKRTLPSVDERYALYQQYLDEGHLVTARPIDTTDLEGAVWYVRCTCGTMPGGATHARDTAPLAYVDVKWWHRGHRLDHGLAWQEWIPVDPAMTRWERASARGEHMLCVDYDEQADLQGTPAWFAGCTCHDWPTGGTVFPASRTEAEVRALADAHLRETGGSWEL